jgi:hypothetical protein
MLADMQSRQQAAAKEHLASCFAEASEQLNDALGDVWTALQSAIRLHNDALPGPEQLEICSCHRESCSFWRNAEQYVFKTRRLVHWAGYASCASQIQAKSTGGEAGAC